mmetsp:Transcript_44941/g.101078  ORF Transcript_44941/g.101078 Transcript_44941/m.101078 type:complete len:297 (+) Transcript_44941:34-924(+)
MAPKGKTHRPCNADSGADDGAAAPAAPPPSEAVPSARRPGQGPPPSGDRRVAMVAGVLGFRQALLRVRAPRDERPRHVPVPKVRVQLVLERPRGHLGVAGGVYLIPRVGQVPLAAGLSAVPAVPVPAAGRVAIHKPGVPGEPDKVWSHDLLSVVQHVRVEEEEVALSEGLDVLNELEDELFAHRADICDVHNILRVHDDRPVVGLAPGVGEVVVKDKAATINLVVDVLQWHPRRDTRGVAVHTTIDARVPAVVHVRNVGKYERIPGVPDAEDSVLDHAHPLGSNELVHDFSDLAME